MPDLNRYKGIVFDMYGTLIDSMGTHSKVWQHTCEQCGYSYDNDCIHDLSGVPAKQLLRAA